MDAPKSLILKLLFSLLYMIFGKIEIITVCFYFSFSFFCCPLRLIGISKHGLVGGSSPKYSFKNKKPTGEIFLSGYIILGIFLFGIAWLVIVFVREYFEKRKTK